MESKRIDAARTTCQEPDELLARRLDEPAGMERLLTDLESLGVARTGVAAAEEDGEWWDGQN